MPGMYPSGEYDIAGFALGAVEREKVLPQSQSITADDVVIGLASSGIHSNGFSLVRQIIDKSELSYSSPSPFSTTEGLQSVTKLGEVLLVPTRIYCPSVLPLMRDGKVKAFAHITGLFFCSLSTALPLVQILVIYKFNSSWLPCNPNYLCCFFAKSKHISHF